MKFIAKTQHSKVNGTDMCQTDCPKISYGSKQRNADNKLKTRKKNEVSLHNKVM